MFFYFFYKFCYLNNPRPLCISSHIIPFRIIVDKFALQLFCVICVDIGANKDSLKSEK